jgi:quinol monooxygenase YgiN
MPILSVVEVEVFPEYIDAEMWVGEKLVALYSAQPGCLGIRLFKEFDTPTKFFLISEWDDPESLDAASRPWAESGLLDDAFRVLVDPPDRHNYHIHEPVGNTLATIPRSSVAVLAHDTASPGMSMERLKALLTISDKLATQPGFLGSMGLDDAAVEEQVAVMHFWSDYLSFKDHRQTLEPRRTTCLEILV